MLIDRTHRGWIKITTAVLVFSALAYVPYELLSVRGPQGGSALGLIYGSAGSVLMLFDGLLGARKKVPTWRLGRASNWMRGHLWLGLLSFPLILFHAGFRLGAGPLTRVLMLLLIVVIASGIFGAVLQQFMPKIMTDRVPLETVYEQIDHVRRQLLEEAKAAIDEICSALEGDMAHSDDQQRLEGAAAGVRGGVTYASAMGADDKLRATLAVFFRSEVQPFLSLSGARGQILANGERTTGIFQQLRILLPQNLWPRLSDLESICEEKRGLDTQRRLHRILHGWLLVHIPASYALLLLGAVHAIIALRF